MKPRFSTGTTALSLVFVFGLFANTAQANCRISAAALKDSLKTCWQEKIQQNPLLRNSGCVGLSLQLISKEAKRSCKAELLSACDAATGAFGSDRYARTGQRYWYWRTGDSWLISEKAACRQAL